MQNSLRARLKNLVHKGVLSQKDLDRIVIVSVDGTGDMISRQAALALAKDIHVPTGNANVYYSHRCIDPQELRELPSVNPQASNEDIHREREQAYMKGYEDASKKYRTEPCGDAISRTEAIRVASGYCHQANIPDELAKLPSVNPIPCDDAISRQEALNAMNELPHEYRNKEQRARTGGIAACKMIVEELPSVSTGKTGQWIPDKHPLASPHCSICNGYGYKTDAFCRTCGAKMEVEESESCKGCPNICVMYDPNMKGCKDKMEGVEE